MEATKIEELGELVAELMTISYSGTFDGSLLSAFAKQVESDLTQNPQLNKKIFKIFVELAQNIAMYSSDKVMTEDKSNFNGFGIFLIKEYIDKFNLIAANMAFKEDAKIVLEKCELINNMKREELREYKRKLRKKPAGQKGGGNIGLVQVVLTANNKIEFWSKEVNDKHTFIVLSIDILK